LKGGREVATHNDDLESVRRLAQSRLLPDKIGRYEILEVLGQGGMGKVYKAYDPQLERVVAIKVIECEKEKEKEQKALLKEAKSTARLEHPNIVRIYEVGHDGNRPYLVMECIAGRSLTEYLRKEKPSYLWSLKLIQRVALALYYAHKEGIIHRDLKPANIMVMPSGEPKVMDFGLAKILNTETSASSKGMLIGTPYYMSPEQVHLQPLDQRTDVYGLGAVFYEMLTGAPPVDGKSAVEIAMNVVSNEIASPRSSKPDIPEEVEAICLKCLQKKPDRRYQSASLLASDIRRFLENKPIVAQTGRFSKKIRKWVFQNCFSFKGVMVFFLVALLSLNLYLFARLKSASVPNPIKPSLHNLTKPPLSNPTKPLFTPSKEEKKNGLSKIPVSLKSSLEAYPYVDSMLGNIWELVGSKEFAYLESELIKLNSIAPSYYRLYQQWGKICVLFALREQKNRKLFASKALHNFALALEHAPKDSVSCFGAYQASELDCALEGQKVQYASILSQQRPEYANYFRASYLLKGLKDKKIKEKETLYSEGAEYCEKALQHNDTFAAAYILLGKFYRERKEYENALKVSQRGRELLQQEASAIAKDKKTLAFLCPTYLDALFLEGLVYQDQENHKMAISIYDLILQYIPKSDMAYLHRGRSHKELKLWKQAIEDFTHSIQNEGPRTRCSLLRAEAYLLSQEYEPALADCNYLIARNAEIEDAYLLRVQIYQAMKQYDKAIEDLDRLLPISSNKRKIYLLKANVYKAMNKIEKMQENMKAAIQPGIDRGK
jgi:serine/threonine protein kinase